MASGKSEETVKVMVRIRPMNRTEKERGCTSVVGTYAETRSVFIERMEGGQKTSKQFSYDQVFDVDSQQQNVYDECAFGLVESVLKGYNGTIFAYGQTGCGKSHTMMGVPDDPALRGIIPNSFAHIFGCIDENEEGKRFLIRCSYLEIYNEEVYDLLVENKKGQQLVKLEVKENPDKGIFVKDLKQIIVKSIPEIESAMNFGTGNRRTAATLMNNESSRSHSIFTIYIETAEKQSDGSQRIRAGKLNLVDLAGSERISKTGATGETQKEGAKINLSLSALGNVISCLVDGKSQHVPYRSSKLTRLLQDSLGGNTKTVMIAACSPADYNYDETLGTLRYASRAKSIKNKPIVNEDPKDALLKQYEDEIKQLKDLLLQFQKGGSQADIATAVKNIQQFEQRQNDIGTLNPSPPEELSVADLLSQLEKKGHKVKLLNGDEIELHEAEAGSKRPGPAETLQKKKNKKEDDLSKKATKSEATKTEPDDSPKLQEEFSKSNTKDQLKDKLKQQEEQLNQQIYQQEQLQKVIQQLEQRLVSDPVVKMDDAAKEEFKKHRKQQLQLNKQRKLEKQALMLQQHQEEEMLFKDPLATQTKGKTDSEEVAKLKQQVKKLQTKFQQVEGEYKDLRQESNNGKTELLDIIRFQEQDLKFSNAVINMMLKNSDLYKLRQKAVWDDNKKDWQIPMFILAEKKGDVQFPTINGKQRVEQAKEEKDIQFEDDSTRDGRSQGRVLGNFSLDDQATERGHSQINNNKAYLNPHKNQPKMSLSRKQSQEDTAQSQYPMGYSQRENSTNIRSSAYKEQYAQESGSFDAGQNRKEKYPNISAAKEKFNGILTESYENLHVPNKRHAGQILEPMSIANTRNLSVPRMQDIDQTVNLHPIHVAPVRAKPLVPIDHTTFKVQDTTPHTTTNQKVGNKFRTLEPLQK